MVTSPNATQEQSLAGAPTPVVARAAGLRYVPDTRPGNTRVRKGASFEYVAPNGEAIRDEAELARIKALAIPPAWEDVWICPQSSGHLQATGRDARGRKQYRYHTKWREIRDGAKYDRIIEFAQALPDIRNRTAADMRRQGLPREKVLATVVQLLEVTLIRVGNAEYARQNKSFGLTTMRDRHVNVAGSTLRFSFTGKHGKRHDIGIRNKKLAGVVKRCQELPGQDLFQYVDDDGQPQAIGSSDVNDYLREISGSDFTAKDFRTWAGTVLAALALREFDGCESEAQVKRNILRAIEFVAQRLGNTPAISRKCYVHPAVLESYSDGSLIDTLAVDATPSDGTSDLTPEEAAVLRLLQSRLAQQAAA